jgi:hypothetical protein
VRGSGSASGSTLRTHNWQTRKSRRKFFLLATFRLNCTLQCNSNFKLFVTSTQSMRRQYGGKTVGVCHTDFTLMHPALNLLPSCASFARRPATLKRLCIAAIQSSLAHLESSPRSLVLLVESVEQQRHVCLELGPAQQAALAPWVPAGCTTKGSGGEAEAADGWVS